ncbi:17.3 kDa class I heat shock protein [Spatholobus suberectus]|nr:17.3 kDa class I heat shock protein [Spatholobus suberectus]
MRSHLFSGCSIAGVNFAKANVKTHPDRYLLIATSGGWRFKSTENRAPSHLPPPPSLPPSSIQPGKVNVEHVSLWRLLPIHASVGDGTAFASRGRCGKGRPRWLPIRKHSAELSKHFFPFLDKQIASEHFGNIPITKTSSSPLQYIYASPFPHHSTKPQPSYVANEQQLPLFSKLNYQQTMSLIPSFFGRRTNIFDPFSLDVWDPFQGFPGGSALSDETAAIANTRIDWKETPEAHVFKADLPGLKKEEVKVEIEEGRVLQISGQRSKEKEDKNDTWHRVERSSGSFLRRFRLPENAKVDQVKAAMENGVLTVTVPKEEVKRPDVKPVQITG